MALVRVQYTSIGFGFGRGRPCSPIMMRFQMFAKRTNWNMTPNRLSEALAAHRAAGKPLIDLTVSNTTECGFEYDSSAILDALRNPAALSYEPNPRGLESARRAGADDYADPEESVSVAAIFVI